MRTISRNTGPLAMLAASLCLGAVPGALAQGSWTFVPSMPTPRWVPTSAVGLDGTLYAIAGFNDFVELNAVEAYDPRTRTWTRKMPIPTARRDLASAVGQKDGRVYAIGGVVGLSFPTYLATVEAYEPSSDTWSNAAPMPTPRSGLAVVTGLDGKIYAMGGFKRDEKSGLHALDVLEAYDPSSDTWSNRARMPTPRAAFAAALGLDGRIYAIGGVDYDRATFLTEVQAYDPGSDTWTVLAPLRLGRYNLGAAAGEDGRIYAAGGFADGYLYTSSVEVYDPDTDRWSNVRNMNTEREGLDLVSGFDGRIYAIGGLHLSFDGKSYVREILSTVEAYTP